MLNAPPPPMGFADWTQWALGFHNAIARYFKGGALCFGAPFRFADADATPSVANGNFFEEANTGATTITDFDGAAEGQPIVISFTTANTTIQDGANIQLAGGANFVGSANDMLVLISRSGVWIEVCRSVN